MLQCSLSRRIDGNAISRSRPQTGNQLRSPTFAAEASASMLQWTHCLDFLYPCVALIGPGAAKMTALELFFRLYGKSL